MPDKFAAGDTVRVLRVPADVTDTSEAEAKAAFFLAVGKAYEVRGVNEIGWLEIDLGAEADQALGSFGNTIWIEPECVEVAEDFRHRRSGMAGDYD